MFDSTFHEHSVVVVRSIISNHLGRPLEIVEDHIVPDTVMSDTTTCLGLSTKTQELKT